MTVKWEKIANFGIPFIKNISFMFQIDFAGGLLWTLEKIYTTAYWNIEKFQLSKKTINHQKMKNTTG